MSLHETATTTKARKRKGANNLDKVLGFVGMTHSFRGVERDISLPREKRLENDMEHSYQLAAVSWYMAEIEGFDLDKNKVIKYALIHDLVEVYAGDTPLYSADEDFIRSKKDREKRAASIIKRQFPEFPELHKLIREYEEKNDPESRFVYAVDKLLPILSIYLDKGHAWKNKSISIEMIIDKNSSRVSLVPEIKKYFDAMIDMIRERPEYFVQGI
ncbi:MAG: HD domain-containing protein [Candidatus Paceibacterota bacterium]|jgi:putative hydrolase of HD superfamily